MAFLDFTAEPKKRPLSFRRSGATQLSGDLLEEGVARARVGERTSRCHDDVVGSVIDAERLHRRQRQSGIAHGKDLAMDLHMKTGAPYGARRVRTRILLNVLKTPRVAFQ